MPFPGVKGILFDYDNTLVDGPPDGKDRWVLMSQVRAGVFPFLRETSGANLMLEGHACLQQVLADVARDDEAAATSHRAVDPIERLREALTERKAWLPEGLLEEALGLDTGAMAGVLVETSPLSQETRRTLRDLRRKGYVLGVVYDTEFKRAWMPDVPVLGPEEDIVDAVALAGDVGYRKPHWAIFEKALADMGLTPDEVVFVGDSLQDDIRGAKKAGLRAAILTHQFRREGDTDKEADAVIDNLSELLTVL
jgi:putative hydrolase of the HAD superfamily